MPFQVRKEKAATKKAEREAAKLAKKQPKAETSEEKTPEAQEVVVVEELEEEVIISELDIDSSIDESDDIAELDESDDEEAGEVELSETKTVGGSSTLSASWMVRPSCSASRVNQ